MSLARPRPFKGHLNGSAQEKGVAVGDVLSCQAQYGNDTAMRGKKLVGATGFEPATP